jgi:prepilin-type processing-associated H-X9-DG protein
VPVKTYQCPSDPTFNSSNPWASEGSYTLNGLVFQPDWNGYVRFPASITDGTSQTIFFADGYSGGTIANSNPNSVPNYWWEDTEIFEDNQGTDCDIGFYGQAYTPLITPSFTYCTSQYITSAGGLLMSVCLCRATSGHTGGCNVGMGDGSVHMVAQGISGYTWFAACGPQDGLVLGSDW